MSSAASGAALARPELGRWREGNSSVEGVWRFSAAQPGREVLVTALVHGNEPCGAWALLQLLQAGLRPRQGALTLALANLAAFDQFDPAGPDAARFVEEDLNRVWGKSLTAQPPRTIERRRALALLPFVERADWLLDLHSMHEDGAPLLLTGLQPRNRALARQLGTPAVVVVDAGHEDGCRLRDHGRFAEPDATSDTRSLLIECGLHSALHSRKVALDMLARFLVAAGTLDPLDVPAPWWQPLPASQRMLEVTGGIVARSMTVRFAEPWRSGQTITEAGTVLGWDGDEPFQTPYAGCTLVMPSLRQLRAGVTVMRLARTVALDIT
jgi:predicted deacylase